MQRRFNFYMANIIDERYDDNDTTEYSSFEPEVVATDDVAQTTEVTEQPTADEFDNMSGDIEEIKYNVQKALGKKYQKT